MIGGSISCKIANRRHELCIETGAALQNFARWRLISLCRMLFAVWRRSAQANECEVRIAGGHRLTTGGRQDKSWHIAARSVGCFCLSFSAIQQCAPHPRNVPVKLKLLPKLSFLHIAGDGDAT
jgi:hypothetical protein